MSSFFERVSGRLGEDVAENDEHDEHPEVYGQLILAMRAAGMDPDSDADRTAFVKMLKKLTPQKLAMASRKLTTSKAAKAGKAAKMASKE